jgi:hypothetical protein
VTALSRPNTANIRVEDLVPRSKMKETESESETDSVVCAAPETAPPHPPTRSCTPLTPPYPRDETASERETDACVPARSTRLMRSLTQHPTRSLSSSLFLQSFTLCASQVDPLLELIGGRSDARPCRERVSTSEQQPRRQTNTC